MSETSPKMTKPVSTVHLSVYPDKDVEIIFRAIFENVSNDTSRFKLVDAAKRGEKEKIQSHHIDGHGALFKVVAILSRRTVMRTFIELAINLTTWTRQNELWRSSEEAFRVSFMQP